MFIFIHIQPQQRRALSRWSEEGIYLTDLGQVTHKCVSKVTIIGSDNGFSPDLRQAITWTNAGILLIRTVGTNLSELWSEIRTF